MFLIYVSDLPKTVNDKTVPILFSDDTHIIVKSPNSKDFQTNMVTAFNCVNKWFKVNLLSINIDKTYYIQFKTKNRPTLDMNIVCNDNLITTLPNIKFLGIYIHDSINWNCHIEYIIPKLSSACYIMRSIKLFMPVNILNSENHTKSTKQFNNFYQPIANLTMYQRGVHEMGIKIFSNFLPYIKGISNNVWNLKFV